METAFQPGMTPPDGYCLYHTGGGCDAFQRDIYAPDQPERMIGYVLITAAGDATAPTDPNEPVNLGIYDNDGITHVLFAVENTAKAVAIAALIDTIGG